MVKYGDQGSGTKREYLSPPLLSGEPAAAEAAGAGGSGRYNNPCLGALTQGREERVHISTI